MPERSRPNPGERARLAAARLLGALPPRAQVRLSGRAAVRHDGQTLDPQLQLLLALRAAGGQGGVDREGAQAARARTQREALVFAGPTVAVGAVSEVALGGGGGGGGGGALRGRHYAPAEPGGPHPLLVWLHGGGFVIGDLDTHDAVCRRLCRHAGVHVLSVAYRLAPEDPFPAAVEDARAALAWAHEHAAALGADPARVGIGGDSAGGTLAAVVARLAAREGGPAPFAQVLVYPSTDRTRSTPSLEAFGSGFFLTREEIEWYHAQYTDGTGVTRADPRISPLLAPDLGGLAPALVVTAGFDPLRDEGEAYAHALQAAGTPALLRRVPELVHGFVNFAGISGASRDALVEIAGATRALLTGASAAHAVGERPRVSQ